MAENIQWDNVPGCPCRAYSYFPISTKGKTGMRVWPRRGQNGLSLVSDHGMAVWHSFLYPGFPGWVQALTEASTVTVGNSAGSIRGTQFALGLRKIS